jgi:hypothetical protein
MIGDFERGRPRIYSYINLRDYKVMITLNVLRNPISVFFDNLN